MDQDDKKILCCNGLKAELEIWNELWPRIKKKEDKDAYNAAGDAAIHALQDARQRILGGG